MNTTVKQLADTIQSELRPTGHPVLRSCPLTWAWVCELVNEVEHHTEWNLTRATAEPEAWRAHVAKCVSITASPGNMPTARVMGIVAEWYSPELPAQIAPGQRVDQYMRMLLNELGVRVLHRLYGTPPAQA